MNNRIGFPALALIIFLCVFLPIGVTLALTDSGLFRVSSETNNSRPESFGLEESLHALTANDYLVEQAESLCLEDVKNKVAQRHTVYVDAHSTVDRHGRSFTVFIKHDLASSGGNEDIHTCKVRLTSGVLDVINVRTMKANTDRPVSSNKAFKEWR